MGRGKGRQGGEEKEKGGSGLTMGVDYVSETLPELALLAMFGERNVVARAQEAT